MIRVTCDGCEQPINRDDQPWFGVDLTKPPEPPQYDEDGYATLVELDTAWTDHEFHFCSAACLSAWAFRQDLTEDA